MSSQPSSDFSIPTKPHVSLAPARALYDDGFILDNSDIDKLHGHSKRTDHLPTTVNDVADHHDVASHAVQDHKDHLETLATIYSVKKERSSQIRETLNDVVNDVNNEIQIISQAFEDLYPRLHQKIRSRDVAGAEDLIKTLEKSLHGLIRKTAHAVDVLEEAEVSVNYGKHHHDKLHERAPEGLLEKNDILDSIGDLLHPVRTILLTVEGAFSRTLVNLHVVREDINKGVTNPDAIFSDKSVDAVVGPWAALREKAKQHGLNQ